MTSTRWNEHCQIAGRLVITGLLELETPAHYGNGDTSDLMDMPVARDAQTRQPVLTGASVAGALRGYLEAVQSRATAENLFGYLNGRTANESALIVNDAYAEGVVSELRDHVKLNATTRTADAGAKYDIEVIPAGTQFRLSFELNITAHEGGLLTGFAQALHGLQTGRIGLGKRKSRGYGYCRVVQWQVSRYHMDTLDEVFAWLRNDIAQSQTGNDISTLLNVMVPAQTLHPFMLEAEFELDGSLMNRSEATAGPNAPDFAHLTTRYKSVKQDRRAVFSGSSAGGAIRARATRITRALTNDSGRADQFIINMFGPFGGSELRASRVRIKETFIEHQTDAVQSRVKIDRFTGGAYPTALFSEQPVFGQSDTRVRLVLELRPAFGDLHVNRAEVGLLLLLLKDIWVGDLAFGGESSVGRGRLRGIKATLMLGGQPIEITSDTDHGDKLVISDAQTLEACVAALNTELNHA